MSLALFLTGVIDHREAEALGTCLDRYASILSSGSATSDLLEGECEFFLPPSALVRANGRNGITMDTLPLGLRKVIEDLHLSFSSYLSLEREGTEAHRLYVCDHEMELQGEIPMNGNVIAHDDLQPDDPLRALAQKWNMIDDVPPLRILRSEHEALAFAKSPGEYAAGAKAYFERRARRAA